jgi:hypothetical protein
MSAFLETAELYTPLTEALEELKRRRGDKKLRQKVDDYFASYPCPPELATEPRIVMAPSLASPNLELRYFLDVCKHLPIRSIFYEFNKDKFVHLNFEKHYLGKMVFFKECAQNNKEVTGSLHVVDFQKDQGKPMHEIKTIQGENFVDFHHRLVSEYLPDTDIDIHDFSEWFQNSRSFAPELPYLRYLGLFICDGILFSNFVTEKYQSSFTNKKVIPAFNKLKEVFGVPPLIVPIEPVETDSEPFWCYYPEEVRKLI